MLSTSPKSPSSFLSKSPLSAAAISLANPVVSLATGSGTRPLSDFDAGINSSAAWTEHLERDGHSLSDEEPDEDGESKEELGRPARALYAFEGKPEFREITVEAGDVLEVMKEDLADGWSLVKRNRETGLLPKTYYIVSSLHVHTSPAVFTFTSLSVCSSHPISFSLRTSRASCADLAPPRPLRRAARLAIRRPPARLSHRTRASGSVRSRASGGACLAGRA